MLKQTLVYNNLAIRTLDLPPEEVPNNLADATKLLLSIHKANGDLSWLNGVWNLDAEQSTTSLTTTESGLLAALMIAFEDMSAEDNPNLQNAIDVCDAAISSVKQQKDKNTNK